MKKINHTEGTLSAAGALVNAAGTANEKRALEAFRLAQAREILEDMGYKETLEGNFMAPTSRKRS